MMAGAGLMRAGEDSSASTSAAKTQILQHAGTGPTARTPTKITRPRYPLKPAVPSESGQVAQNLALNLAQ